MTQWTADGELRWRALRPFGVEVDRNLAAPMAPETAKRFLALFDEHGLIVAHNQSLSRERHDALLRLIGPTMLREGESGYITSGGGPEVASAELTYHADGAYTAYPFEALSLHAVDLVDGASSTRFVHAAQALDSLPDDLRETLRTHDVEMISPNVATLEMRSCDVREHRPMYSEARPGILVNPRTGRPGIGVSEMHAARINGMTWEESRDTMHRIFDHLYAPDAVHEHVWYMGDVVIWDNVTLQHARGSLRSAGRRVLQRVIVGKQGLAPEARVATGRVNVPAAS